MTVDEFLLTKPCLEEISGFLKGLPGLETVLTDAERDKINAYRERLMSGKVVPEPSYLTRAFTYRLNRTPVKVKGRA